MAINLSFPKPRKLQYKFVQILRTDNATEKAVLPKGATVVDLEVCQTSVASTDEGAFDLGLGTDADGLIDGFAMTDSAAVGLQKAGATVGDLFGVQLTADMKVTSTYVAGSSTAGGEGWVKIGYLPPLPNESMFS